MISIRCAANSARENTESRYRRDPADRVWRAADGQTLNFSDGDPVEERLLKLVKEAGDLTCGSMELAAAACDWPSHYHLSPQRADLLRPLRHLLSGSVLEIGAGCGALTRYLGECGGTVVALEGSDRRAQIAALRCRDLDNVLVVCDSFRSFCWPQRFQAVVLVGVLEYSPLFMAGPDPVAAMLKKAADLLLPGGALILAIENQLGLKYFAGAPEDHLGTPFHGINDLYRADSAVTFGRLDLEQRLGAAGFAARHFLYPWPDYKFPVAILHPAAFRSADFDPGNLIRQQAAANQATGYQRLFAEEMAWPLLLRNGLAEALANSFLVVARLELEEAPLLDPTVLASIYATRRHPSFAKETRLLRSEGQLMVRRQALHPQPPPSGLPFRQILHDECFLPGPLYVNELYTLLNRPDWTSEDVARWAAHWLAFLQLHRLSGEEVDDCLPPEFVDCTPFNIITGPEGQFFPFDLEWLASAPVPLPWVIFRGLLWSIANLKSVAPPVAGTTVNVVQLVGLIMTELALPASQSDLGAYLALEERLFATVCGGSSLQAREGWERLSLEIRQPERTEPQRDDPQVPVLARKIAGLEEELTAIGLKLSERDASIRQLQGQIEELSLELQENHDSKLWRTSQQIRAVLAAIYRRRSWPAKERD